MSTSHEFRPRRGTRYGAVVGIRPETADRYEELHRAVPPTVLAMIADCNIVNYSIHRHGDLLFSYLEYVGKDYDADMARMAADRATQRWWELCSPLQVPVPGGVDLPHWTPLPEVFHVD